MDLSLVPPASILLPSMLIRSVRESLQQNYRVAEVLEIEDTADKQEKLLLMARRKSLREQSWAGWIVLPFVILTLLGNIPSWVVISFWALTLMPLFNEIICISSRDYLKKNKMPKRVYFSTFCIMLTLPLTIAMIAYTVIRALSLL